VYHEIVERGVRRICDRTSVGDHRDSVREMSPFLSYVFPGEHALREVRRTPEGMRRWCERPYTVFLDLRFEAERPRARLATG
jgi:hypothetical protein